MTSDSTSAPQHSASTVNAENPWPGLLAFRESDQYFFHGRAGEVDELLRVVMRERLVVLFGLSGLGKSSLLQAGLFPRVRPQRVMPVYIRLDFAAGAPDLIAQVMAALSREAALNRVEAPAARPEETLWEYFHRAENTLWNDRNRPVMPLLVFDQFEEIFTLGRLNDARIAATDRFLEQLADIVEGRPPAAVKAYVDQHPDASAAFDFGRHHYKVLLSIREDFLPDLESLRPRMPALALNRFRLRRMNGEAALQVVAQAEHLIERTVARQVVAFVSADRGGTPLADLEVEPALLSVVCRELNNKRLLLGHERITAGLLEGSQQQVLADFYERSIGDLPREIRLFIEDRLLTVSGFRDTVALENALKLPGVTLPDVDRLVERRLLRREERGGVQRLELTHDLLAGVVRASRDSRRLREDAEQERLALVRRQEEEQAALFEAQEQQRLEQERASEQEKRERERRELKRTRAAVVIVGALLLLAATGALLAVRANGQAMLASSAAKQAQAEADALRRQAEDREAAAQVQRQLAEQFRVRAEGREGDAIAARGAATAAATLSAARELSTASLLNSAADPELGLLLALAAVDTSETPESADVLHRALSASRVLFNLPLETTDQTSAVLASLDATGTHALLIEPTGKVTEWDLSRRVAARVRTFPTEPYEAAAIAPDRRILATAQRNEPIRLWDLHEQRMIGELTAEGDEARYREYHKLAFSPNGEFLAVARCADVHRNLCPSGIIDVWNVDVMTRKRVGSGWSSIDGVVLALAWESNNFLAAAGNTRTGGLDRAQIAVWTNVPSDVMPKTFKSDRGEPVNGLAFRTRGMDIVYSTEASNNTYYYVDSRNGERDRHMTTHAGGLRSLVRGPVNAGFATIGADLTVRLWDIDGDEERLALTGHKGDVWSGAFSGDGTRLVTIGSDGVKVWNIGANGELASWSAPSGAVIPYSGNGRLLTVNRTDQEAALIDILSGRELARRDAALAASVSGDGRRLAYASGIPSRNTAITIEDIETGERLPSPKATDGLLNGLRLSGNGRRLLILTDVSSLVWDVASAAYLKTPVEMQDALGFGSGMCGCVISDDGQVVVVQDLDRLLVWNVASGHVVQMRGPYPYPDRPLVLSPDKRLLAVTDFDGKVVLLETGSLRIVRRLAGHAGGTTAATFTSDGTRLATAGLDKKIRIWEFATGRELLVLSGPGAQVMNLAFNSDGRQLAAATARGEALVYALTVEDLVRVARSRITRSLTPGECRQFLHRDVCKDFPHR
jgi:WD40 repeat protein